MSGRLKWSSERDAGAQDLCRVAGESRSELDDWRAVSGGSILWTGTGSKLSQLTLGRRWRSTCSRDSDLPSASGGTTANLSAPVKFRDDVVWLLVALASVESCVAAAVPPTSRPGAWNRAALCSSS